MITKHKQRKAFSLSSSIPTTTYAAFDIILNDALRYIIVNMFADLHSSAATNSCEREMKRQNQPVFPTQPLLRPFSSRVSLMAEKASACQARSTPNSRTIHRYPRHKYERKFSHEVENRF
jgi:hypothetical protein